MKSALLLTVVAAALSWGQSVPASQGTPANQAAQNRPDTPADPAMDLVKQARKLNGEGKQDEALQLYRQAQGKSPKLVEAWLGSGAVLDLMGRYDEARKDIQKAIDLASPEQRPQAMKTMAISYAFTRDAKQAAKFEVPVYDEQLKAKKYYDAGETADELARICLESGDLDCAQEWYKKGHDAGVLKPDLTDKERDLWEFRYEHAQARLAARRSDKPEAERHVAAAKAILDRGVIDPQQAQFFPYLKGYVEFYTGDTKAAIADLQQANQRDPFILVLLGEAYDKSGDKEQAQTYYRKVLQSNIHNPTNAFARPVAKEKVGQS